MVMNMYGVKKLLLGQKCDTIVAMDFIIIFLLGYFFKDFSAYLKRLVKYQSQEFDWISFEKDDLP